MHSHVMNTVSLASLQGQWRGGVYHGEGSILDASGVTYKGMWVNGTPAGVCTFHCVDSH